MSSNKWSVDMSEGEDEELMFAFEEHEDAFSPRNSHVFHSIDGFERPVNPIAATLDSRKRDRQDDDVEEPEALDDADSLTEEKPAIAVSRKRKTFELPTVPIPARVVRPVVKRFKSSTHERSITAPACLVGTLSLHHTMELKEVVPELENEDVNGPFRSASINIPNSFQPIFWPGDAMVLDRAQSFSSSSSSKSWTSFGSFCRRSLDVSSSLRVRLNDLVLHSSAGSYTGS